MTVGKHQLPLTSAYLNCSRRAEKHNKLTLYIRTKSSSGLLVWSGQAGSALGGDFFAVAVVEGRPELSFNLGRQTEQIRIRAEVWIMRVSFQQLYITIMD